MIIKRVKIKNIPNLRQNSPRFLPQLLDKPDLSLFHPSYLLLSKIENKLKFAKILKLTLASALSSGFFSLLSAGELIGATAVATDGVCGVDLVAGLSFGVAPGFALDFGV